MVGAFLGAGHCETLSESYWRKVEYGCDIMAIDTGVDPAQIIPLLVLACKGFPISS